MDIVSAVNGFLTSIDFSKLVPILLALLSFVIILRLRTFGQNLAALWSLKSATFVRKGDLVRLPTATGHADGTITEVHRTHVVVDMGEAVKHIPTKEFAYGTITVVKPEHRGVRI